MLGAKILVLDDSEAILETLGMVLESYGYRPLLAATPEKAFALIASESPRALILDLTLGMDSGEEVHAEICRQRGQPLPTLVASAVRNGEERAKALPGALFLAKPYHLEQLAASLETLLGSAPTPEAMPA